MYVCAMKDDLGCVDALGTKVEGLGLLPCGITVLATRLLAVVDLFD